MKKIATALLSCALAAATLAGCAANAAQVRKIIDETRASM